MAAKKILKPIEKCHASIANTLLRGTYSLTIVEKRILLLILARLNSKKSLDAREWYCLDIVEYATVCNITLKSSYDSIAEAIERLFNRRITNVIDSKQREFRWIYEKEIDIPNKLIRVKWTDSIIPYISELTKQFTRFYIEDVVKIESIYASCLFDLLYQEKWKGLEGTVSITVLELHKRWTLPETYKDLKFLKVHVLTPAIKELSKKNLVNVTLEHGRKEGRKVAELLFHFEFIKKTNGE